MNVTDIGPIFDLHILRRHLRDITSLVGGAEAQCGVAKGQRIVVVKHRFATGYDTIDPPTCANFHLNAGQSF